MFSISGHHHVSMITKDANITNHFYKTILGLRRVKMTVNQDDPSMYHLFYGDRTGSPGTELTFFEMPMAGKTYRGTNAITKIGLLVSSEETLMFWKERFKHFNITHGKVTTYVNRPALHFEDKDGLQMVLLVDQNHTSPLWEAWEASTVPNKHQIKGMGPIEITVRRPKKIERTLTELFGFIKVAEQEDETIFQSTKGEPFGEIIIKSRDGFTERPGRGSIHHLAIRAKNEEELKYWDQQIRQRGFISTGILDRFYFKSLYFRESNGIMFEIATDGPGFTVDGNVNTLGETLDLPPFLEDQRKDIEANLTPIEES